MSQVSNHKVENTAKSKRWKRFLPIALIAAGIVAAFALGLDDYLSFQGISENRALLQEWAAAHPLLAVLGYMAIYAVVVALSLPGGVWMTLIGGFVFGTLSTTLYAVAAASVGASLIFLAARYAFADMFLARAGSALLKMEDGFKKNAFNYLLVLRLVPLFPFWLVNLVPALLNVRFSTYVIATFIGIIPGTFVYASVGAGLGDVFAAGGTPDMSVIFQSSVLLPLLGLALLSLVPVAYSKFKAKKGVGDA